MPALSIRRLALCLPLLLAACDNGPSPPASQGARPGVDKTVSLSAALPPPQPGRYEPGITPDNEEKSDSVGQIVPGRGGQKVQKEKAKREQSAIESDLSRQRAEEARQRSVDEKFSSQ
jgi:hypothetical protein